MFDAILKEIQNHNTIIIHRHKNPDGDALGSQIGMKHLILENFPEKTVYMVGDEARFYGFMDDSQMDEIPDSAYEGALAMILDCGSAHLISDDRYTQAARTVRMDHHMFTGKFADTEAIDTSFESCCGLIVQLAESTGLRLNAMSAKALYTGMVTDSGRFRYDATTSRTFHLASVLLQQDFDITDIYRELYADAQECGIYLHHQGRVRHLRRGHLHRVPGHGQHHGGHEGRGHLGQLYRNGQGRALRAALQPLQYQPHCRQVRRRRPCQGQRRYPARPGSRHGNAG